MSKDKSYALIEGVLQEYDVCLSSLDNVYQLDYTKYERLGYGTIDNVCGVKDFSGKMMYFYKKIVKKEKRSSW